MSEFHHTITNMIWVRGNELAPLQRRPIDIPPDLPPPPNISKTMRAAWPIGLRARMLSEPGVEIVYGDTIENFEADFGEHYEGLPDGIDERVYRQGRSHALNRIDVGTIDGGPMPWAYGDRAIAALRRILQAQADRQPPPPTPEIPEPPLIISHRQLFQAAALKGIISQDEALAAVQHGTLPAKVMAVIEQLPPDQKFAMQMLLSGAGTFDRNHPAVDQVGHALGLTDEQIDEFFKFGATL